MAKQLSITSGQFSSQGRKPANQDFHGIIVPKEPQLSSKGIAIALADGISSSAVGHIASEAAVTSFLDDYYCTSDAWTVKTAALRVLAATNSWLFSQSQSSHEGRYNKDKGYVCTFSALIIKSSTAHILHVGDSRIFRVVGDTLEQLTHDHRVIISDEESYLGRALGINAQPDVDYAEIAIAEGDTFVLATDGVYEFVDGGLVTGTISECGDDLERAARNIVDAAFERGSTDNLTCQIVRVDTLPNKNVGEIYQQFSGLPLPPLLEARMQFEGYTIVRNLHSSSRSHVYLAVDDASDTRVVIKTPSVDLSEDNAYLERFMMEEWIARRVDSAHILKPFNDNRTRNYLYTVTEYVEGQSLAQWMADHPEPDLEAVRDIIDQIAKGLRAFHRMEMVHQDLRPENVLIDRNGTVKIIDFGSALVAGIAEIDTPLQQFHIQGTPQFTAPEYFLGELGTPASDQFSLAVIAYQMLSGRLPYGTEVARTRTRAAQRRLNYQSVLDDEREIPGWVDYALRKAVNIEPTRRYDALSEFVYDLRHPNRQYLARARAPLLERNPVAFWKGVSLLMFGVIIVLLANGFGR